MAGKEEVSSKIIDYSKFIPKDLVPQYIDKTKYAPQWPFTLLMTGKSGSGKTNCLLNLIFNQIYWDNIYVYAKDLSEPSYVMLKQQLELINGVMAQRSPFGAEPIYHMSESIDEVVDIDSLSTKQPDGSTRHNLIIFDDFCLDKNQSKFEEYFMRGRKKGSVIYLSQSFFQTVKFIRMNAMYLYFFQIANKLEIKQIAMRYATDLTLEQFEELFKLATEKKYDFFQIDLKTTSLPLKYRRNFTGLFRGFLTQANCPAEDKRDEDNICVMKPTITEVAKQDKPEPEKRGRGRPRLHKEYRCDVCGKDMRKPNLLAKHKNRKYPCKP